MIGVLGQVIPTADPTAAVANGMTQAPLAWGLALALAAVAYLFRQLSEERKASATALEQARKEHLETVKAGAKDHREILEKVVPLSSKLSEGLEVLERITDKLTRTV